MTNEQALRALQEKSEVGVRLAGRLYLGHLYISSDLDGGGIFVFRGKSTFNAEEITLRVKAEEIFKVCKPE